MSVERRRQMIEPKHPRLSIARQCELVSISRSGFYFRPAGETPLNLELMRLIDAQFLETPWHGARSSSRRSACAPLAFSRYILPHPSALSWASCASSVCPNVLTRAYPRRQFSGLFSVISFGKRNPLIERGQEKLPKVFIFGTRRRHGWCHRTRGHGGFPAARRLQRGTSSRGSGSTACPSSKTAKKTWVP